MGVAVVRSVSPGGVTVSCIHKLILAPETMGYAPPGWRLVVNERHLVGVVAVILGVLMVAFRRGLAQYQVQSQNESWGFQMGQRSIIASRFVLLLVGVALVAAGALMLAGFGSMRG
jgi:hypothetical protein